MAQYLVTAKADSRKSSGTGTQQREIKYEGTKVCLELRKLLKNYKGVLGQGAQI
jgi:hypothetical protein